MNHEEFQNRKPWSWTAKHQRRRTRGRYHHIMQKRPGYLAPFNTAQRGFNKNELRLLVQGYKEEGDFQDNHLHSALWNLH